MLFEILYAHLGRFSMKQLKNVEVQEIHFKAI